MRCVDMNMLTIHGKSRFPGLHIWLRDGRRMPVRVPDGCLLLQARVTYIAVQGATSNDTERLCRWAGSWSG